MLDRVAAVRLLLIVNPKASSVTPRRRIAVERTLRDERIARHAEDARPAVTGVTHLAFIALRVTRGGARVIRESI